MVMPFFNQKLIKKSWSEDIKFCPANYVFPTDVDELIKIVRTAHQQKRSIRVIGSGHSFSKVASCDDLLVSLDNLQGLISVDQARQEACFFGGTKLFRIGPLLKKCGLALPNMGDIDEQSLAGALQTGTHGTGVTLGCLSSFITELTLLLPHGELLTCNSEVNNEIFSCARLALGTLGIVVSVTVRCIPSYVLEDRRWPLSLVDGLKKSEDYALRSRHFEFFWFPYTNKISVKELNVVDKAQPRNAALAFD
jgi:FAD/FMN-containing dehydrogenase